MKASEVHGSADPDVVQLIGNKRQELFNLRFQHATGQLEDTTAMRRAKRDLARALTVARERGIDVDVELAKQRKAEESGSKRPKTQLPKRRPPPRRRPKRLPRKLRP